MNHILIFFHFMSFVTGIGLMTLVYYLYTKNKNIIAKKIILSDIFYTFALFIDTLDLYLRKNLAHLGIYHNILILLVGICSIIGICIFIPVVKIAFANAAGYNLRSVIVGVTCLVSLGVLSFIITGVFKNMPLIIYRIPVSPLIYFCINGLGVLYIKNHLLVEFNDEGKTACPTLVGDTDYSYELINSYNITEREIEIIRLVKEGFNNQDIGKKLFISPNTVKNHIYSIYRKMGIKNRFELISFFAKNGGVSKRGLNTSV